VFLLHKIVLWFPDAVIQTYTLKMVLILRFNGVILGPISYLENLDDYLIQLFRVLYLNDNHYLVYTADKPGLA
jgi:hypothetical protein